MMKKCFALLLAMALCLAGTAGAWAEAAPVLADDGWYLETALDLAEKMGSLADNEAYVELYLGIGQDTDGFADTMAQLNGLEPDEVVTYAFCEDALQTLAAAYQMDEVSVKLAEPAMEMLARRMNSSLGSLLNGYVGGDLWLAISTTLALTETYIMPEDFAPCALFLLYEGQETAVLVTFTQTGEETITAAACYVRADAVEDEVAQSYLELMWERTSDPS